MISKVAENTLEFHPPFYCRVTGKALEIISTQHRCGGVREKSVKPLSAILTEFTFFYTLEPSRVFAIGSYSCEGVEKRQILQRLDLSRLGEDLDGSIDSWKELLFLEI